jgi:hypothetical protein
MSAVRPLLLLLTLFTLFLAPLSANAAPPYAPVTQNNQPVRMEITSFSFDEARNVYRVGLAIDRPDRIQRVVLNVESEAGTVIIENLVNPAGNPNLVLEFNADELGAAGKFLIKIRAVDLLGNLVEKQDDLGNNEEPSVLASREFTFNPDANTVNFTIESVNADYINEMLIIILNVEQPQRVISYEGFGLDSGGQRILEIPQTILPNPPRLVVPMPTVMRTAGSGDSGEAPEYKITINLNTLDGQKFQQVFEGFKPIPPPPPGMMEQVMQSLNDNPILPIVIIAIISGTVVFIILRNRKPAPDLPSYRPPVDHTVEIYAGAANVAARQPYVGPVAAPTRRMRLRIRVIESPGMQPNTELIIDDFPYVFGRGLWLNDPQMSREHATITMKSGQFFITDNKSRNGTTVRDLTLTADQTVPLEGSTIVRLGLNTMLEIEPYG